MKKLMLIIGLISLMSINSFSQVQDISLNVAPTLEYTFWDNNLILQDAPFVGGRVGFGLGKFMEIRGLYMKSVNLRGITSDVQSQLGQNFIDTMNIAKQEVDIIRWGGELKANIGLGRFSPYVLIGSGVQTFKYNKGFLDASNTLLTNREYKEEQIFVNLGLGLKINLTNRLVFSLEGRNTMFNLSPQNLYVVRDVEEGDRAYNWSAAAALEIYLGGRNPNEMTALDKAYLKTFTNGFRGAQFVVEPGVKYLNFSESDDLSNTYMIGGAAGVDITDFIGLRAFYYQATKDEKISLNFHDKMSMYGGNFIARLNYSTGFVPFITLGGGYLDVKDGYQKDKEDLGGGFAFGGLGIDVPLSKYIMAYGSASSMLTTEKGVEEQNVAKPSDLKQYWMYDFGVKFKIGARQKDPKKILAERERAMENKHQAELDEVKANYESKIEILNIELEKAYEEGNVEKAIQLIDEKKKVEQSVKNVNKMIDAEAKVIDNSTDYNEVNLSKESLEEIVNKVMREIEMHKQNEERYSHEENLQERIDILEKLFLRMNMMQMQVPMPNYQYSNPVPNTNTTVVPNSNNEVNKEILKALETLNKKLEENNKLIQEKIIPQVPENAKKGEKKQ